MANLRGKRPFIGKWYRNRETGLPFCVTGFDEDGDVRLSSEYAEKTWCFLNSFYERYKRIKEYDAKPISRMNNK